MTVDREEFLGPNFCCDGAGQGAGHDPWCEEADPAEQEHFIQSQHLGRVDFSVTPSTRCDSEECCGDDDSDDGCGSAHG